MTDFTQIEAEAFEEHQAAKAAEEARKAAAQEAKWAEARAGEAEARKVRNQRNSVHLEAIAKYVPSTMNPTVDKDSFRLTISGMSTSQVVDFSEMSEHLSKWRSRPSGKMKFTVGPYGARTNYPQRKDGSFNYLEIANRLVHWAISQVEQKRIEQQRVANQAAVAAAVQKIIPNKNYQDVIVASADVSKPVRFNFKIAHAMTEDEAVTLAAAIRAVGIKLHYTDEI